MSDSCRIVAAVANHTIWPWPSTFTLEGRNPIDQRQSFLRVIPVGIGLSNLVEFVMDERDQARERGFVALPPGQEQFRDVRGMVTNTVILGPFPSHSQFGRRFPLLE